MRQKRALTADRTQLVDASVLLDMGKKMVPFRWTRLERLTRSDLRLISRLEALFPASTTEGAREAILSRLRELFDEEVRLFRDHVHVILPEELPKYVATPTFLTVLAPAPHKPRGLLEIELGLAHAAIDLLLGGAGESVPLRELTDIEEGVMSYVVLEALKTFAPNLESGLPKLRLEGVVRNLEQAIAALGDEQQLLVIQLKATLGAHAGFIRMFVPSALMGMAVASEGQEAHGRLADSALQHLGRVAKVRTWLRAEIGYAELTSTQLAQVGEKDVILLESVSARPDQGGEGTATLRVGLGRAGAIAADVFVEEGRYKAKLAEFVVGDPGLTGGVPNDSEESAYDELAAREEHDGEEDAAVEDGAEEDGDGEYEEGEPEEGSDDEGDSAGGEYDDGQHDDEAERDDGEDEGELPSDEAGEEGVEPPDEITGRHELGELANRGETDVSKHVGEAEGAELLGDIPLQIVVELGRVAVTAEQVVGLKVGQVLDLGRVPGEPVDLSVNGKVVARGELVDIEGQLGVRILSLAG